MNLLYTVADAFYLNLAVLILLVVLRLKRKFPAPFFRTAVILTVAFLAETAFLFILSLCLERWSAVGQRPFHWVETVVFCAAFSSIFLSVGIQTAHAQKILLRLCGLAGVIPFFLEVLLFNFPSYLPQIRNLPQESPALADAELNGSAILSDDGQSITVEPGGSVTFSGINTELKYLTLRTDGANALDTVSFEVKDGSSPDSLHLIQTKRFTPSAPLTCFSLRTTGKTSELSMTFNSDSAFTLQAVSVNTPRPFNFNLLRYMGFVLLFLLLILVIRKKLWKIDYDGHSKVQRLILGLVMLICMGVSAAFLCIPSPPTAYPLSDRPDEYNNYIEQFDAFQKGQLNLDVYVDPKLSSLENPYDIYERNDAVVYYLWDRAFFNGKYYSYFGVAPLLLIYYPYYFLTGKLPGDMFVCTVLAILSILFLFLAVLEIVKQFCKKVNFSLLLLGLFASVMTAGIYMLQSCADEYYIPALSGCCFSLLFLFLSFRAVRHRHNGRRLALFAAAGVSYILILASRPNLGIIGLAVVPAFLSVLLRRDAAIREKLSCAFSFLFPVLLGGAAIMIYNSLRFDSPFQFGAIYQLTVSDISLNKASLKSLGPALYHYFLQPPKLISEFPFVSWNKYVLAVEPNSYIEPSIGALFYPSLTVLLLFPLCLFFSKGDRLKKSTLTCMALTAVLIAFVNYCIGGIIMRYAADMMPTLSIVAMVMLLDFNRHADQKKNHPPAGWVLTVLLYGGSILVCTATIFLNERNRIAESYPQMILYLERVFLFR